MTRVRLPPDPSSNNCITTIVDSRGADSSLASAAVARGLLPADHASSASLAELGKSTGGSSTSGGGTSSSRAGAGGAGATASSSEGYGGSSMRGEQPESSAIGIGGATASSALLAGGMGDIDCIVLVYDLDRVETFYRLENHWLPLIERCFSGEVRALCEGIVVFMECGLARCLLLTFAIVFLPLTHSSPLSLPETKWTYSAK
jgi:hypothetical protein